MAESLGDDFGVEFRFESETETPIYRQDKFLPTVDELSLLTAPEIENLTREGFTPIERETVEIDGVVEPSNMVLCEKDGKPVRVRLEPGNDHLTGAFYEDTEQAV